MAEGCHHQLIFSVFLICICLFQVDAVKPIPNPREAVDGNTRHLQDSIVEIVNSNPSSGWQAAHNPRLENYTIGQFKHLLGVKQTPSNSLDDDVPMISHSGSLKLPKEFDARAVWSHCPTIGNILDQGHCGSCWAFAAVEALQDRFCIHHNLSIALSVNDVLACCGVFCGDGCDGGYPIRAWMYFVRNGIVTNECDPYFDSEGCAHPGCSPTYPTPSCEKKCKASNLVWDKSKHYSVDAYRVKPNPSDIMEEVYLRGPLEVDFTVYEDFAYYKSGVYKHITGYAVGGHAVKIIGWGTSEKGEDYWLIANQWNRGWGDVRQLVDAKDGYFKIVRGRNECGIEDNPVAGLPSTKNIIKNLASMEDTADAAL